MTDEPEIYEYLDVIDSLAEIDVSHFVPRVRQVLTGGSQAATRPASAVSSHTAHRRLQPMYTATPWHSFRSAETYRSPSPSDLTVPDALPVPSLSPQTPGAHTTPPLDPPPANQPLAESRGCDRMSTAGILRIARQNEDIDPDVWPTWVHQAIRNAPGRRERIIRDLMVWMMLDGLEEVVRDVEWVQSSL